MITFPCGCGQILKAKPELVGKAVRCPKCANVVMVPADAAPAQAPADRPRLRSEARRETTPVTSVQASSVSEGPVLNVAGVTAPHVSPRPAESRESAAPQKKPRVAPPLPPKAIEESLSSSPPPLPVTEAVPVNWRRRYVIGGGAALALVLVVLLIAARGPGSGSSAKVKSPEQTQVAKTQATSGGDRQNGAVPVPAADVQEQTTPHSTHEPAAAPVGPARSPEEEEPAQQVERAATPPRTASPPRNPGGLVGVSRQYDDLDCTRIQAQHSIRVPSAATILEVDGQRLPIANLGVLAESRAPFLYLPRGTHAVRFRPRESPVEVTISSDLSQIYHDMRQFFHAGSEVREMELLSRGAKAMDVHSAPFLLNLMGAAQLGKSRSEPAERKFRRALRVNPLFAPGHLNLAVLLMEKGATEEARRELELAEATNVGNCFGLSPGIAELRRRMKLPLAPSVAGEIELSDYMTQEPLSEEDRRITALMQGLSKYAVEDSERGKILNNLAVHFAETGRAELALDHFRSALAVLKSAGPERYKLAQQVLSHMSQACRKVDFEEADEYEQMRRMVSP